MRFWTWLWTVSGGVGVLLTLYKLSLIALLRRASVAAKVNGDTAVLLQKARRDNLFRLFNLSVIFLIGLFAFTQPPPPPFRFWNSFTWISVLGFESIAISITVAVALDIRDRLRLMYGSVGAWVGQIGHENDIVEDRVGDKGGSA